MIKRSCSFKRPLKNKFDFIMQESIASDNISMDTIKTYNSFPRIEPKEKETIICCDSSDEFDAEMQSRDEYALDLQLFYIKNKYKVKEEVPIEYQQMDFYEMLYGQRLLASNRKYS